MPNKPTPAEGKDSAKQETSGGRRPSACCASFEGDDDFVIRNHEMNQEWQGVGQTEHGHPREKILMWTDHLIEFDSRKRPFKRGDRVTVDGVELFVTGYAGQWIIAEGREMHFRHNSVIE